MKIPRTIKSLTDFRTERRVIRVTPDLTPSSLMPPQPLKSGFLHSAITILVLIPIRRANSKRTSARCCGSIKSMQNYTHAGTRTVIRWCDFIEWVLTINYITYITITTSIFPAAHQPEFLVTSGFERVGAAM